MKRKSIKSDPLPSKSDIEQALDEGLRDSFPASDPVSATRATRTGAPGEFAMRPESERKRGSKTTSTEKSAR